VIDGVIGLGCTAYGGSTIVLLVPSGKVQWDQDLVENSKNKLETAVKVSSSSLRPSHLAHSSILHFCRG